MTHTAVIGIKPGLESELLLQLFRDLCPIPSIAHLVTFVQVGVEEDERSRFQRAELMLQELGRSLLLAGHEIDLHVHLNVGSAGVQLAHLAGDLDASLLFLGLGKRTKVGKVLLGSDAQSALLGAPCPVVSRRLD